MKPYGMTRLQKDDVDCAGIRENGRKGSVGRLRGKGGDIRSMQRVSGKRRARILIKRQARRAGKKEIQSQNND